MLTDRAAYDQLIATGKPVPDIDHDGVTGKWCWLHKNLAFVSAFDCIKSLDKPQPRRKS